MSNYFLGPLPLLLSFLVVIPSAALSPLLGNVEGSRLSPLHNTVRRRDPTGDNSSNRPPQGHLASSTSSTTRLSVGGGYSYPEPQQFPLRETKRNPRWDEYVVNELEAPTATQHEPRSLGQVPPRPRIVVFGASGRIGRRVVRKLLRSSADVDIVAFVRDAKRLERVLYDEEDLVVENVVGGDTQGDGERGGRGPSLRVVVGDVVSQQDLQCNFVTDDEKKVICSWVDKAKGYFAALGSNYTNCTEMNSPEDDVKASADVDVLDSGGEEALREATSGATVLISCLAALRPSDIWMDYLRAPVLRVFRRDASRWCPDPCHPYYVHFLSTKKILEEAEREQGRRSSLAELEKERLVLEELVRKSNGVIKEEAGFEKAIATRLTEMRMKYSALQRDSYDSNVDAVRLPKNGLLLSSTDRVKFIRISNLMVGRSPFRLWSVITNIFWSQLSRFELMSEMLMEASKTVDTIVLRPGFMTDDERNANHTSLQLRVDGRVDYPSLVGREDVADLAVVSALTSTCLDGTDRVVPETQTRSSAYHYTWAMRWTGQHLMPPQGLRPDGLGNAALCFARAINEQKKIDEKRRLREDILRSYHGGRELMRFQKWRRRRLGPFTQSLAVSVPLYATLGLLGWYLFGQTFMELLLNVRRLDMPQIFLKLIPSNLRLLSK